MIPCDREAPLVLEIEPDIEDGGAMSEPADRDQIDAGRGGGPGNREDERQTA